MNKRNEKFVSILSHVLIILAYVIGFYFVFIYTEPATGESISPELDYVLTVLGSDNIKLNNCELIRKDLPDKYYGKINFSSYQSYMDYRCIKNKSNPAYLITHSERSYTDVNGFRRYFVDENNFRVLDTDDFIVALGTFYKPKGECGVRFLIVTTNGMFTVITGDEKSDNHTDKMNMFTTHGNHDQYADIIEWIVDTDLISRDIKRDGTVTSGELQMMSGKILHIYQIIE